MAPLPKRKYTKSSQGKRRSHLARVIPAMVECTQCHSPKLSHEVCKVCGSYAGKEVIAIKSAKAKKKKE
jgi:large subunit ribosomal protein L32